ncbi:hypothetical protein [Anaerocolumna xylanovorans]|uniref:Outer membrane efflux protein n=1 Tax=Anaerocolumna xylanovorans DSM 12503 TaxID=1121345 RepID=A0A1M7YK99_9FIRM|nr:hypothetical protein [Anaerocolumna xylanovorans]SHO52986.1 hypothetical protein SAMN02745217_03898 [Anaerocolumna xylanovorans DSM 12503]
MKRVKKCDVFKTGKLLLICLVITTFCLCSKTVSAETVSYLLPGGGKAYDFRDVIGRYESYGIDYQINRLQNELQAAKALTAGDTYNNARSDYLYVQAKIQELSAAKDRLLDSKNKLLAQSSEAMAVGESNTSEGDTPAAGSEAEDIKALIMQADNQLSAVEAEIASYQKNAAVLAKSASDAKLSQDLAEFYKNYQNLLTQDGRDKARHSFMQSCLNLIINEEGIKYYTLNQEYIGMQKQIEDIKYQHGYSTKGRIDDISLSLLENDRLFGEKQNDYNFLSSCIKRETGIAENDTIQFNITLDHKNYTAASKVNAFMDSTPAYLQLKNMETSYQNYLSSDAMASSAYRRQTELTVESYRLQKVQVGRQIEDYVKKAINAYEGAFRKMLSAKTELDIADNKCKIIEESFKCKRATQLEVKKAYLDRQSVSLKFYSCCMEVMQWEDILDNNIYQENQ